MSEKLQQEIEQLKKELAEEKARSIRAEAISIIRSSPYQARSPEQLYKLFFDGQLVRDQSGQVVVQGELGQTSLADAVRIAALDPANSHHFVKEESKKSSGPIVNPFMKGKTFNLTQQGQILKHDRPLAEKLAAEAGVKLPG